MNKRLVWFTELFIWAILILALIIGFSYSSATSEHKNHSYYMFFKDVDGLSKGSVVRMMGYQIGYVRDVKVFKDNIFVSFMVTEKNVYIPSGSVARVEFYGLGGSKSLEIEPPHNIVSSKEAIILTKNPYRIHDYYNWGEQINSTLEIMMNETSSMLDSYINSGFNISFFANSAQKINSMLQSFIKDDNYKYENNGKCEKEDNQNLSDSKEIKTNEHNNIK